jgi:hypothetical protein
MSCAQVKEGSPSEEAGLEPFFDYIVGVNQQPIVRYLYNDVYVQTEESPLLLSTLKGAPSASRRA